VKLNAITKRGKEKLCRAKHAKAAKAEIDFFASFASLARDFVSQIFLG
jgi:hypothetical protein